jgi:hypothetical protein
MESRYISIVKKLLEQFIFGRLMFGIVSSLTLECVAIMVQNLLIIYFT